MSASRQTFDFGWRLPRSLSLWLACYCVFGYIIVYLNSYDIFCRFVGDCCVRCAYHRHTARCQIRRAVVLGVASRYALFALRSLLRKKIHPWILAICYISRVSVRTHRLSVIALVAPTAIAVGAGTQNCVAILLKSVMCVAHNRLHFVRSRYERNTPPKAAYSCGCIHAPRISIGGAVAHRLAVEWGVAAIDYMRSV